MIRVALDDRLQQVIEDSAHMLFKGDAGTLFDDGGGPGLPW